MKVNSSSCYQSTDMPPITAEILVERTARAVLNFLSMPGGKETLEAKYAEWMAQKAAGEVKT